MSSGEHDAIEDGRGEAVEAGGTTFEVVPLRVHQIPKFARAIRPLMPALQGAIDFKKGQVQLNLNVLELLDEHGERVTEAVAVASQRSAEDVGDLELDDFIKLARAVIEVNLDFFVRRLLPALTDSIDTLNSLVESQANHGPMQSKGSSARATQGAKS